MTSGCIFKNGASTQVLRKLRIFNQIRFMLYHERERKNKENANFVYIVYLLTKLCNIFDEAFFIDVSIVALLLFIFISKISTRNINPFPAESQKREFIMNGDPTVLVLCHRQQTHLAAVFCTFSVSV